MEMYLTGCGCVVLNVMECVDACTGEVSTVLAKLYIYFIILQNDLASD